MHGDVVVDEAEEGLLQTLSWKFPRPPVIVGSPLLKKTSTSWRVDRREISRSTARNPSRIGRL